MYSCLPGGLRGGPVPPCPKFPSRDIPSVNTLSLPSNPLPKAPQVQNRPRRGGSSLCSERAVPHARGLVPRCSLHYSRHPGSLHTPQVPQAAVPLSSTILPPVTQSLNPRRTSVSNLSPAAAIVYVCSLSACSGRLSNP